MERPMARIMRTSLLPIATFMTCTMACFWSWGLQTEGFAAIPSSLKTLGVPRPLLACGRILTGAATLVSGWPCTLYTITD